MPTKRVSSGPEELVERARRKVEAMPTEPGRKGRLQSTALWHIEQAQARLAEAKRE